MALTGPAPEGNPAPADLSPEARRWLHDKYERLAAEEGQLSTSRTSYYAAIGTVLITGLLVVVEGLTNQPLILTGVVTFLASLGILISSVWAVLLHRTNDAKNLWREAARRLEETNPPLLGVWKAPITLRSGTTVQIDLLRPYLAHQERFATERGISWMDRANPAALTEVLPLTFLTIWGSVLAIVWVWYLVIR